MIFFFFIDKKINIYLYSILFDFFKLIEQNFSNTIKYTLCMVLIGNSIIGFVIIYENQSKFVFGSFVNVELFISCT